MQNKRFFVVIGVFLLLGTTGCSWNEDPSTADGRSGVPGGSSADVGPQTDGTPCDANFHLVKRFTKAKKTLASSPTVAGGYLWLLESYWGRRWPESMTRLKRWDGSAWETFDIPQPEGGTYHIQGVDVTSDGVAWVAGVHDTRLGDFPLVLRFDETRWRKTSTPQTRVTQLWDIEMWSPDEGWAVGSHEIEPGEQTTLTLHWNGDGWSVVDSPVQGLTLESVSIGAPSDVWATGFDGVGPPLRWDGKEWQPFPPSDDVRGFEPLDVEVTADGQTWIAGFREDGGLVLAHWDGSGWTEVALEEEPSFDALQSVDVGDEAWAVGERRSRKGSSALAFRRTPRGWEKRHAARVGRGGPLLDVVVTSDGTAWATGRASSRGLGLFGVLQKACVSR